MTRKATDEIRNDHQLPKGMENMRTYLVLCLLPLLFHSSALAQVGILVSKKSSIMAAPVRGFKSIVSSQVIELNMEGKKSNGEALCKQLKGGNPKVVLAVGKLAAKAAVEHLPGIPLVYCMVMYPKKSGIKGPKVTGVSLNIPMIKQFESFRTVIPNLKKIGLVYSNQTSSTLATEMKKAAGKLGMTLVEKKVADDKGVPNAIRELKGQIQGLYLPPDRKVVNRDAFQFIALFTFENNLPFMAPTSRFVKKGALIALMIDYEDLGKQAGEMTKKILGGKSPASVPIEPPRATIMVLNLKTAKTIGINIPPSLLESSQIIK
jgi:putative ABC transport system substrate-binding protein